MFFKAPCCYSSSKYTWPPKLPSPGLLPQLDNQYCHLSCIHKSEWGIDEWRLYAQFLEEYGSNILDDLTKAENEVVAAKGKASRRKNPPENPIRGLIDFTGAEKKPKRGRRPGSGTCRNIALEALKLKEDAKANGKKITDRRAAKEVLLRSLDPGLRQSRVDEQIRGVINEMSRIRNNINR